MSGTWRPLRITSFSKSALQELNQGFRETNGRIDLLAATQSPQPITTTNALLNFGTINAGTAVETVVNMPGVTQQHIPSASPRTDLGSPNLIWSSHIVSANQVLVRVANVGAAPFAPNIVRWNVICHQL